MKKKEYERPSTRVIELQHKTHLLQASGQADVQNYQWNNVDEE